MFLHINWQINHSNRFRSVCVESFPIANASYTTHFNKTIYECFIGIGQTRRYSLFALYPAKNTNYYQPSMKEELSDAVDRFHPEEKHFQ